MSKKDQRIEKILQTLKNKSTLCECVFLNSTTYNNYITKPLQEAVLDFDYEIVAGASKVCIVIDCSDYVIKIPFNSVVYYDNEEEKEKLTEEEKLDLAIPFFDATDPLLETNSDWDYCALECAIYEAANEHELAQYFALEEYYGDVSGYPVYIQEKASPLDERCYSISDKQYDDKIKSSRMFCSENDLECFEPYWIAEFIKFNGEEEFKKLTSFLKKYNIRDLRPANIGFLGSAPVLFDYSNYREW